MYLRPNFPPYFNNNFMGLDPITGFDFELVYYDPIQDDHVVFGKFQTMNLTFDGFDTFNWSIKQGLIDATLFKEIFKVDLNSKKEIKFDSQLEFIITYPEIKDGYRISNLYLTKSVMSSIKPRVMPGRRIAVVEAIGSSYAFFKQTL